MKGILIVAVILVSAFIFVVGSFGKIAAPMLQKVVVQEGTADVMKAASDAAYGDDAASRAFAAKYEPFLNQRYWLGRVSRILDDDTFLSLTKDTLDRYVGGPMEKDPRIGWLLFNRAEAVEDHGGFAEAWQCYLKYTRLFPGGPDINTAKSAVVKLVISHGFSE
jgi:hypothetical protein